MIKKNVVFQVFFKYENPMLLKDKEIKLNYMRGKKKHIQVGEVKETLKASYETCLFLN